MNLRVYGMFCLFGALFSACGGGNDSGPTGPEGGFDVTGAWSVTITVTGGDQMPSGTQFSASMSLSQTGTSVTGNTSTEGGLISQVTGTVNGTNFTFTLTQNAPCQGTFNGSGTVAASGELITASYMGSDCNGSMEADLVATKLSSSGIMAYGLLGVGHDYVDPETVTFWAYGRVFNHPDYTSLEAELVQGESTIPLEKNYSDSDMYFTEGSQDVSFGGGEEYTFRMRDSGATYSGTIVTLPLISITADTVLADNLSLEWTNVGADFYDIEFRQFGISNTHFQTEDTEFSASLTALQLDPSQYVYITVSGFTGFSPLSDPHGNIQGCTGYLFGYSSDRKQLDLQTMLFSRPNTPSERPDLDQLVLMFHRNSLNPSSPGETEEIDFIFTYAVAGHFRFEGYEFVDFHGASLVTPANVVTSMSGSLDDKPLTCYSWGGFYNGLQLDDDVYAEYDSSLRLELELSINQLTDAAIIAVPDSFSILSYPGPEEVPTSPFEISWSVPANAEFFFVDVSWHIQGDAIDANQFHVTEGNSFTISGIPDGTVSGLVEVIAVNGANPMRTLEPNLEFVNGYFYSVRVSDNWLTFGSGPAAGPPDLGHNARGITTGTWEKIDDHLVRAMAEENLALRGHEEELVYHWRELPDR